MIIKNISLKKYNSFRLDYKADSFIHAKSENDLVEVLKDSSSLKKPLLILGGGSNILFISNFTGTIIHPDIGGTEIEEKNSDYAIVSSGAGVNWDSFVEWTVELGLGGLENLSMIPGSVGASPVQNIGAYGAEAKDCIEKVKAVSVEDGSITEFSKSECRFGYRTSIFKNELKGKYLITRVYYRLSVNPVLKTDYGSLNDELIKSGKINLMGLREAVMNIRRSKLPDPKQIGNAGSFFKNPVVNSIAFDMLKKEFPQIPGFRESSDRIKLPAGWMIEQCGWKGKRSGDAGVHGKQALVLVNYGNASGEEIFSLSESVKNSVLDKFGIELEREVEVI